jgi:hypothetical protein
MKLARQILLVASVLATVPAAFAGGDPNFSGSWRLKSMRSGIHALNAPVAVRISIRQQGAVLRYTADASTADRTREWLFRTDGRETRSRRGRDEWVTVTKWEGAALLINSIVLQPRTQYTDKQVWKCSRDNRTLIIRRDVIDPHGQSQSEFIYERE